jgi:maltooligosyltrehalose trehalohydrolase
MVFVDVVYNHFGPSGNFLHAYAERFFTERHQTPWGAGLNFDGEGASAVRDFFVHNALYWLEEFHADGLRFDAVHAILDDSKTHILSEIARRVRAALPKRRIHLVLENDANEARWLSRNAYGPRLYTAQWSDDIHHGWHAALTAEGEGYYVDFADDPVERLGRALAEGFAYQGDPSAHRDGAPRGEPSAHLPPSAFVSFLQNHDQIGNRALGERLNALASPERLALARAGLLLSPQIPLLFMGEEWGASAPFLFFVDFDDEELSTAVREGRRREFAQFPAFADPEATARIPDPTAGESFDRSKLDWDERERPAHAEILADTRRLLELRQAEIVPLLRSRYLGAMRSRPEPSLLNVTWRFAAGLLRFCANLGEEETAAMIHEGDRLLWSSSSVQLHGQMARLPGWTGMLFKGSEHE